MTTLATCWSMTINNPDENDMVLVRNPNPEYIRQLIWTPEAGDKDGTPHVQCFVKLMKQQRMSFIKKLYPRGHFKSITADEYKHNCSHYAQKDDKTTIGSHVITYNEQIPDVVQFLRSMLEEACGCDPMNDNQPDTPELWMDHWFNPRDILNRVSEVERRAVAKRPSVSKLLVSPTYTRVKKLYLREIVENIVYALYHTNADDDAGTGTGETDDDQSITISSIGEEEEDQEGECETDEGTDSGSESDCEEEGGDEVEY